MLEKAGLPSELSLTAFGTLARGTPPSYYSVPPWRTEISRGYVWGQYACPDVGDGDHQVMATIRIRRQYDHRLRRLVQKTGDVQLAVRNGVPRSTARDWSRLSALDVVSLDVLSMSEETPQQEVVALRQHNAKLVGILRLVVVLLKVSGYQTAKFIPKALLFLRKTGLRIQELLDLKVDALRDGPGSVMSLHVPLGKLHSERVIPISDDAAEMESPLISWVGGGSMVPLTVWSEAIDAAPPCPTPASAGSRRHGVAQGVTDRAMRST